jgi:hypothetical protein
VNTIMIQIVLRDPAWRHRLTNADRRGLSALFWTHECARTYSFVLPDLAPGAIRDLRNPDAADEDDE